MKRTIYLISGLILLALILGVLFFLSVKNKPISQTQQINFIPTAIPVPTSNESMPLQIIKTDPPDKSTAVAINQIITVTFNRIVRPQDVTFLIQPNAQYAINVVNNQMTVTFTDSLAATTAYTYRIKHQGIIVTKPYTFMTADDTSAMTNDNAAETLSNWSRANEPDLFLYNKLPYTSTNFSVAGASTQTPPYHYYFTVSLTEQNIDEGKKEFVAWLTSLGLTNDQIQKLDVRFQ